MSQLKKRSVLSWHRKVLFSATTLISGFFVFEVALALFGIPDLQSAIDLETSFSDGATLFVQEGEEYRTRAEKTTYFNVQSFPVRKTPGTYRIFCLGGSTTYGHPYADAKSYVGMLRELFRTNAPDVRWEVINCGGISYASYRLADMMTELATYQPDLIVVYTGQNEFLEERTFREIRNQSAAMKIAQRIVGLTRTGTVFRKLSRSTPITDPLLRSEVDTVLDHPGGLSSYHRDDQIHATVVQQYRESLDKICRRAGNCGAKVIFIEPASNFRFSPFKSEHSVDEIAIKKYDETIASGKRLIAEGDLNGLISTLKQATAIDPKFALTHYWLGEALFRQGKIDEALPSLQAAIDEDVCPLRAISALHESLKGVAEEHAVPLLNFPLLVASYSAEQGGSEIPGQECFLDHVHPRPELHLRLALEIVRVMYDLEPAIVPAPEIASNTIDAVRQHTLEQSSAVDEAMALCNLAQVLTWAGKVAEALPLAEQALELDPTNVWIICQYARLLDKHGRQDEAKQAYRHALKIDPLDPLANYKLGAMLLNEGHADDALPLLLTSEQYMPDGAPIAVKTGLSQALNNAREMQDRNALPDRTNADQSP